MERNRDLGQTSTSYLGLVVLAGAVVAAVLALGIPRLVGGGLERAVCTIVGRGGCGSSGGAIVPAPDAPTPLEVATGGTYVAMGDSFTSGEGTHAYTADSDTEEDRCHRSPVAYSRLIADRLDFAGGTDFVACSGARTRNVLRRGQHGEPPQIEAIDEGTSLVTIGIGGNDAGWADLMKTCLAAPDHECLAGADDAEAAMQQAADEALAVYEAARDRAPDGARIIAVGYPRFFPRDPQATQYDLHLEACPAAFCSVTIGISPAEQRYLNAQTGRFNQLLADRAAEAGIEFVDLTDVYEGHEFGTDDPYLNGLEIQRPTIDLGDVDLFQLPPDIADDVADATRAALRSSIASETMHPNRKGQRAAARRIRRQVEAP